MLLVKYKRILSILAILALLTGLGVFVPSGATARVSAAGQGCFADNSGLCSSTQCKSDAQGNSVDCNSVDPATSGKCSTSSGQCDFIGKYINPAIQLLSGLVGVVAVISIIYGAIQYTTSGGDPKKVSDAKGRITKTIAALIAFAFLYAFLQFLVPGGVFNRS